MRIWSLHRKYIDTKGLVALWRETLLAQHVLNGKTKGYVNHPQLNRFKASQSLVETINQYLAEVYFEAERRNFKFDKNKIDWEFTPTTIKVNSGQIEYEIQHLLRKLETRDIALFEKYITASNFELHSLFEAQIGPIEDWEVILLK
ncbi:MAG: pyrimidine dimer DNA glycosylase/endonuclease V [Saprospiraceae bacterium]